MIPRKIEKNKNSIKQQINMFRNKVNVWNMGIYCF